MIYCKELNKEFETKAEMFVELRKNHKKIIADKSARIYNTDTNNLKGSINIKLIDTTKIGENTKGIDQDSDFYYLAVNTTKILDSHEDLHINNIWNKSAKEQQGKVYLVWDHNLKGQSAIVAKEDIEMFVAIIPFAALGMPYDGETEALIYKFKKTNIIDNKAEKWLESGKEVQASVRMQYVKMLFALDSMEAEDKEFKKNFDMYHGQIANIADFDEIYYFWPILEAKNVLESSLVLFGSNHVTGIVSEENKQKPSKDTSKHEPSIEDTQKSFYNNLKL